MGEEKGLISKLEQQAQSTDIIRIIIKEELEKKGFDIGEIARILASKG